MRPGLRYTLVMTHRAEAMVIRHLRSITERHRADPEIQRASIELVRISRDHLRLLERCAARRGLDLALDQPSRVSAERRGDPLPALGSGSPSVGSSWGSSLGTDRQSGDPLILLEDLRRLYLLTSGAALDWELLAVTAQTVQERELLELVAISRPQTLRQVSWTRTMLETAAPQALASAV